MCTTPVCTAMKCRGGRKNWADDCCVGEDGMAHPAGLMAVAFELFRVDLRGL